MNIYVTFPPGVAHFINVYHIGVGGVVRKHCLDNNCVFVFDYNPDDYTYDCIERILYDTFHSDYKDYWDENSWIHSEIANFENGYIELTEKEYFSVWSTSKRRFDEHLHNI